jgi:mono/diheme cytochrome c family protein
MNCEGCHGVSGLGAAPEIASLINPVRATSAALIRERMKKIGAGISRRDAAELANQARGALIKRLHEGGHDMPPFQHLTNSEIRSLVAYLRQLAKVPGADGEQVAIQESNVRIGELIVKSTCHICHGATGKNPNLAELSEGAIPPLSALPARVTETQLERKVTSGSPVITDEMSAIFRGRMPVFSYLAENEAADVYEYLTQYPPAELPSTDQSGMPTRAQQRPGDQRAEGYRTNSAPPELYRVKSLPELGATVALPISAGLFAIALFVLGGWITAREFRKISVASPGRSTKSPKITATPLVRLSPPVELVRHRAGERTDPPESKTSPHLEERKIS